MRDDVRNLLGPDDAPNRLDPAVIVARSRARRRPKQIAAGALGALAIAGVTVLAVQTIPTVQPATMTMSDEAGDTGFVESAPSLDSEIKRAPADKINLCTGTLAEVAPSQSGLQLAVDFPAVASVSDGLITGTVTMTNTSDATVTGFTASAPAITLSQDGVVLWHSNGPMVASATIVDLEPGETLEYNAFFMPVSCGVEDDLAESFRSDLSVVSPGTYDLTAAIDFTDDSTQFLDLVTGPAFSIELQ